MSQAEHLITEHLDIWTTAIENKGGAGRGGSKRQDLYGIKKLRELILELAVRGLLVSQDPNDEPASVLLEKIAIEKERLVKAGKIKKQNKSKPFDVIDKELNLPQGWSKCDFGDITFNRDAERIPLSVSQRSGRTGVYDYYGASGVIDSIDDFLFDKPLLLIGEDGANLVNRSTPIAFMAHGKYWVNNHAHVIDGISENFLKYLGLYINSISLLPYITGMAQPKMNQAKMNAIPVFLPPENEMPRVLAKVDELMALCDQLEQQTESSLNAHQTLVETLLKALLDAAQSRADSSSKETAFEQAWQRIAEHFDVLFTTEHSIDQLKQTILQLAVMGKLVPQDPYDEPASVLLEKIAAEKERLVKEGKIKKQKPLPPISEEEKPFELPEGWEWCRLQDAIDVRDGTHDSPKDAVGGNTYPLITSKNFENGEIDFESARQISEDDHSEICKRSFVEVDDILFSMIGGNIGNQVMVKDPRPFSIKNVALFKYYSKSATYPSFFKVFTEELAIELQEKASGGAQPFVSLGALRKLVFALPPYGEQEAIVEKVDELMAICNSLKDGIRESQTTQLHLADTMAEQALG